MGLHFIAGTRARAGAVFLAAVVAAAGPSTAAIAGATGAAESEWMSESELETAFYDVAVEGKYADGRPFHERYNANRRVEYREGGMSTGGTWSVQSGTFCTIYDGDSAGGCFRVKKVSGNCFEFYFVARTEAEAERDPRRPAWTARASIVGKPGACQDDITV